MMHVIAYIQFMQAKLVIYVSDRGEVTKMHAKDVPAALHAATNGRFKLAWAPHVYAQAHITFEQLDEKHRFAEMRIVLESDATLAAFLRYHMQITSEVWNWNFTE